MASSGTIQSKKSRRTGGTRRRSAASTSVAADTLAERVREVGSVISGAIRTARQQAAEKTAEGARLIREEVEEYAASKKGAAAARVESVGETVRNAARSLRLLRMEPVADYLDRATEVIQDSAGYLEERDITEIVDDLAGLVRRNPAMFLGTLLIAGFGAARFLKAFDSRAGGSGESSSDIETAKPNRGGRKRTKVRRRAGRSTQNGRAAAASSSD